MKKIVLVLFVIAFSMSLTQAQAYKDGWAVGVNFVSPRLFGDVDAENLDFGGGLNLQKNLSEKTLFRVNLNYLMFTAKPTKFTNNTISLGWGVVYNLFPCEPIQPYFGAGASILYYTLKNAVNVKDKSYFGELSGDIFFGGLVNIGEDLFASVELGQHTVSTDKFDGTVAAQGGLFGGALDSYTTFNLGILYYFDAGTKVECDDMAGLSAKKESVDYNKIEDIVKKYAAAPSNVDYDKIEDIVKRHAGTPVKEKAASSNWVLVGVNFESGKASLSSEAYPVLVNAAQVLIANPDMKVEVQGHTDNIGSDSFNKKLSEQRAETVKRFLVAKGVNASRLSTVGVGSSNPVSDNKTAEGRALNRRIEFKVLGK